MFSYLMRHSYAFFQNHFAGSLTKKITDIATNIESIFSIVKVWFFPRILAVIVSTITLFIVVKPIFGIILFVWAILFIYLSYIAARSSEKVAREYSEAATK